MQAKPFYQSKTIIGAVMVAVSMGCRFYQLDVPQDQIDAAAVNLAQAVEGIAGLAGFVLVVWGRIKARSTLTLSAPKG